MNYLEKIKLTMYMNNSKFLLIFIVLAMAACTSNNDLSDAYGNFEATEITVSAEANGKILIMNTEEGTLLKKGEICGNIDSTDLTLKKLQLHNQILALESKNGNLNAQLDIYRQQRENIKIDKARVTNMFKDGSATQKQLDDIESNIKLIDKQELAVKSQFTGLNSEAAALRNQLSQIDENLKRCNILNPIDGMVLAKYAEAGELTAYGKPLYKIADMENMILRVYISGAQLSNIKPGDKVKVLIDKDEKEKREMEGLVSWISNEAEFTPKIIQTRKERVNMVYAVKIFVKNDGYLKIGMPGEVVFENKSQQ
jgi:HlyD family secretion protein